MIVVTQYGHIDVLSTEQGIFLLNMLEDGATDDEVNAVLVAWGHEPIPPAPAKPERYKPKEVWLG